MKLFDEILYKRSDTEEKTLFTMKYTNNKYKTFLKEFNHYQLNKIIVFIDSNKRIRRRSEKFTYIISNIDHFINLLIEKINHTHLELIQLFLSNNGEVPYKKTYIRILKFYYSFGLIFPVVKDNKQMMIMPPEVKQSYEKHLTKEKIKLIDYNTTITKFVNGLVNLYGLMEISFIYRRVNQYLTTPIKDYTLHHIIFFDSVTHSLYHKKDNYIVSHFIYPYIQHYIKKRSELEYDYYPFTDEDIINANEMKEDINISKFVSHYRKYHQLSKKEAIDLALTNLFILKEDISYNLLNPLLNSMKKSNDLEAEINMMIKMNEITPKWSLKGYKYKDLDIENPLTYDKLMNLIKS